MAKDASQDAVYALFAHVAARVNRRWCGWTVNFGRAEFHVATDVRVEGRRHWELVGSISIEYAELLLTFSERKRSAKINQLIGDFKSRIKQLPKD